MLDISYSKISNLLELLLGMAGGKLELVAFLSHQVRLNTRLSGHAK